MKSILWILATLSILSSVKNKTLVRKGGITNEGFGSYVQHIKTSIIMASYYDLDLVVETTVKSSHGFHAVGKEFIPDMYDCIAPWLWKRFSEAFTKSFEVMSTYPISKQIHEEAFRQLTETTSLKSRPNIRIGIHRRWGDVRKNSQLVSDIRSIGLGEILLAMENIVKMFGSSHKLSFFIFMERSDEATRKFFESLQVTVVDTHNDYYELFLYSTMDIYIQGFSAFGILGSSIHHPKLQKVILTDIKNDVRYKYNFYEFNKVYNYSDMFELPG
eukprot:TRINITY_DN513_c0_g1_i5.p1 TRINITY_DN513_c0_g1~~TRINITY_DN513_c0_g1_i5.p1  ORF type:complete len:273 (-),score=36.58 TRINITY_DN513_c0_g1_i5:662-1480(-)